MTKPKTEFLWISEAVNDLEAGMFGGPVKRPVPVEAIKQHEPRLSVGFGPHRQEAAKVIHKVILEGSLPVYVVTQSTTMIVVPVAILQRMPEVRGGLPDHPARHPVNFLRGYHVAAALFDALSTSALHLRRSEFDAWYKKQKSRRRWPSQTEVKLKNRQQSSGRPTKQTIELLISIKARAAEGRWSARDGIAKLAKLLRSQGAPKRNTVRRAVDRLYVETGDPTYRIIPRNRSKSRTTQTSN
ncbi:hypothetical protein [Bradyrhizobium elkanii]|uniref:hypothetical protein n=1 Tax=Bradyrhizobium elkanii TaxID=29448 RepID=UPI00114C97F8|nr:hypothetical protein [Bradyrhizobium elkanii]